MVRAREVFSVVVAAAVAVIVAATSAPAVDIGPLPGACPTEAYSDVGPYPASHVYCVRTHHYATLSVDAAEVGDGSEFTLTLALNLPRCTFNGPIPCVDTTFWGAGDAVGSGPSYRLIDQTKTYFRVIGNKNYYYVPFNTTNVSGNGACTAGSNAFAESCRYRVDYHPPNGMVPPAWAVWNMRLSIKTRTQPTSAYNDIWLEAVSRVIGEAVNQAPTASFTSAPHDDDPLTVDFDASASSDDAGISSYAWDFGDGQTGGGGKPTHTFAEGGSYFVRLTVTDAQGLTDEVTHSVAVNQMLSAEMDGAQVPVGDQFELELRVTNNGMVTINELTFPNPPVGLRVLDTVDPGKVKGELLLDLGPVPPLPTSLKPGETKSARYVMYPSALGQVWLTTEVTGVDTNGGEHSALAAGVVEISDAIATLKQLEGIAYYAVDRLMQEAKRGGDAVQKALLDRFLFWVSHWGDPNNPPPPPTALQRRMASLIPYPLTPEQREQAAYLFPADLNEVGAMYMATQEGLWEADKRVAREVVDFGKGAWRFGTGGPRVWKATATEIVGAVKGGKGKLDGALTSAMTPLFTYASASEQDKQRMRGDVALALQHLPARTGQIADEKIQQGTQAINQLAETYKNDKVGFVRKASEEINYWNIQAGIAVMTDGVGTGLTQAASKSPKLLQLLEVVGGGNAIKGAQRAQAAYDMLDILSPITQIGTETTVPLLEPDFPDGITQEEAEAFIEVATQEEQRLKGLGYDVEIGIGAAQASPESARAYAIALEAHKQDPSIPLPTPKGEALKDFKSLTGTDVALGCPPEWAGFTGVYKPQLPQGWELLPDKDRNDLLARAEVKQAEYDAYMAFKNGNAQSKASKVLEKAAGPNGGTFDLDFDRKETWALDFEDRVDDAGGVTGALFKDRRTGTGIIADIDIVSVFDKKTGKALDAGIRAQTNLRIKAALQKKGVRLADHGWEMFDLRSRSKDLKAAYRANLERLDPEKVDVAKAAEEYAERINNLWGLSDAEKLAGKDLLKGARLGRTTVHFSRRLLPRTRLAPLADAPVVFTVDTTADAADAVVGDRICAAAGGGCSLRAAVQEAAAVPAAVRIVLPGGRYTLSRPGAGEDQGLTGDLDVGGDCTIEGAGATTTIIDAAGLDRALDVKVEAALTLSGVTLTGGSADGDGGALRSGRGRVALSGVIVQGNLADGHGGGVSVNAGTATLTDVTFDDNAGGTGGGLSTVSTGVAIANSRFTNNRAEAGGGAGVLFASALSITDTTFAHNAAISDGGGLWIQGVEATGDTLPALGVTGCTFTENDGGERGGAVAITHLGAPQGDGQITFAGSTFSGNVADRGGAVDTDPDLTTIDGCTFEDNRATRDRGGAVAAIGPLHVLGSRFARNRAEGNGGALHSTDDATVAGSTFEDNASAAYGGAVAATGSANIDGSTFARNQGDDNGGALAFSGARPVVLSGSTLTDNHSDGGQGGAIYRAVGLLQLGGNTLSGNTPAGDGDGIHLAFGGTIGPLTTTTLPGACSADTQCDDRDACTQDACGSGQCTHTTIGGFAGADCLLAKVLAADVCAGETVQKKLAKALDKGVAKVRATLAKAQAASGKKQAKLVKKARTQLAGLTRKVQKNKKTPATCRATLVGYLGAPLQLVQGLAP